MTLELEDVSITCRVSCRAPGCVFNHTPAIETPLCTFLGRQWIFQQLTVVERSDATVVPLFEAVQHVVPL